MYLFNPLSLITILMAAVALFLFAYALYFMRAWPLMIWNELLKEKVLRRSNELKTGISKSVILFQAKEKEKPILIERVPDGEFDAVVYKNNVVQV